MSESSDDRLMRLLDDASDFVMPGTTAFDNRLEELGEGKPEWWAELLVYQRAQAAALGAIAFLLMRHDDLTWQEWSDY